MDPLSDVLSLLKPAGYAFRGLDAGERWALRYPAGQGIKCYAVQAGACWLRVDGLDEPVRLDAGSLVLLPRGHGFRFDTGEDVPALDAEAFFSSVPAGEFAVLAGGGHSAGVGGYFELAGLHAERLLAHLPPVLLFESEADKAALRASIDRLMRELREPGPGSALIAGHVAQAMLVEALRLHLSRPGAGANGPGWLPALADRRMNAALTALHARPAHRWTLDALAREAGMSRSSFAAAFKATVGEPALEYLARWRMLLAADRLVHGRQPVSVVAPALGYESESAFGAAFKRVMGQSPGQYARERRGQDADARPR